MQKLFVTYADVAQLAEQLICNQQVIGSSPIIGFYGWVPEWPKGADCKSVSNAFGGSNPPPSIDAAVAELADAQDLKSCGTYTPVPVRFRFAALKKRMLIFNILFFIL